MNTFLNFLENRKQFITEGFNSKKIDKVIPKIIRVPANRINLLRSNRTAPNCAIRTIRSSSFFSL